MAPGWLVPDLVTVSLANVVAPLGIAQDAAALTLERSPASLPLFVAKLQRWRNAVVDGLRGLPLGLLASS